MKKSIREVRVVDLLTYVLLPIIALLLLWLLVYPLICNTEMKAIISLLLTIALSYYPVRRLAVGLVLIYKILAPMKVRSQCRFEPTCSTYMIMAINKYGLVIGITKGIIRLTRCHPPNGGVDYP